MEVEDEQIMLAVRAGDVGQLERLFDRHHRALFHFFLHITASRAASEDMVQEVFYRVLKYRHTYQPESSFRVWLFQVGRNVHRDSAGRNKGEVPMPDDAVEFRGPDALPEKRGLTPFSAGGQFPWNFCYTLGAVPSSTCSQAPGSFLGEHSCSISF
jgi:DNA-directed RNA polymerase specialized sigma24 family protein